MEASDNMWRHFQLLSLERERCCDIQWVNTNDASTHPTRHRTACPQQRGHQNPSVSSTLVKKAKRQCRCILAQHMPIQCLVNGSDCSYQKIQVFPTSSRILICTASFITFYMWQISSFFCFVLFCFFVTYQTGNQKPLHLLKIFFVLVLWKYN